MNARYAFKRLRSLVRLALAAAILLGALLSSLPPAVAASPSPQAGQTTATAVVDTGGGARLNLRAGPGTGYPIIGKLYSGERYAVLGRDAGGQWLQLAVPQISQGSGWVFGRFVDLNVSLDQLDIVPAPPVSRPADAQKAASPTGKIAFPGFDSNRKEYDIYVVDADGSNLRLVVTEASQPALSPDGGQLAFRHWKRDNRGIVVADVDGSNPLRVATFFEDGLPAWSPDGTKLVFSSNREVDRIARLYWLWADAERDWVYMRGPDAVYGEDPLWMPDGRILYRAIRTGTGLVIMNGDGSNPVTILADETAQSPALSPDGRAVAFMSMQDGNWELYRIDVDGGNLRRLTTNAASDGLPAWSPDGRSIAFASSRDGKWGIWIMDADGSNQRLLVRVPDTIDGRVYKEPPYLNHGWLEEQLTWSP